MLRWRITFAIAFAFAFFSALPARGQSLTQSAQPEVVEHGKFILHKFEQPIGEETFDTTSEAQSLVTRVSFKFVDRGTSVPLTATFRSSEDLTPQAFEIRGKPARPADIDEAVEVQKKSGCATAKNGLKLRVPSSSLRSPVTLPLRCRC